MNKQAILNALGSSVGEMIDEILIFDEIDSTNLEALRQIKSGSTDTRLILATAQTAGRGRRNRQWVSTAGSGIYMSLAKEFMPGATSLQSLSLVAALSVLEAVEQFGASDLQLKWPNDVLVGNKKLAGILLELHPIDTRAHIVFGIGLNTCLSKDDISAIDRPVTDLSSIIADEVDTAATVAAISTKLLLNIQTFNEQGFTPFQERWNSRDRYLNSDIVIQKGSERIIGKSHGVDQSGALILLSARGRELITGGEIFPSLHAISEAAD